MGSVREMQGHRQLVAEGIARFHRYVISLNSGSAQRNSLPSPMSSGEDARQTRPPVQGNNC
jgi:hypothetical protein